MRKIRKIRKIRKNEIVNKLFVLYCYFLFDFPRVFLLILPSSIKINSIVSTQSILLDNDIVFTPMKI